MIYALILQRIKKLKMPVTLNDLRRKDPWDLDGRDGYENSVRRAVRRYFKPNTQPVWVLMHAIWAFGCDSWINDEVRARCSGMTQASNPTIEGYRCPLERDTAHNLWKSVVREIHGSIKARARARGNYVGFSMAAPTRAGCA